MALSNTFYCLECNKRIPTCFENNPCINGGHEVMKDHEHTLWKNNTISPFQVVKTRFPNNHAQTDLVVSTDASFRKGIGVGLGVLVRTGSLDFVWNFATFISERSRRECNRRERNRRKKDSNYHAELDAVLKGVEIARDVMSQNPHKYLKVIFYTDCKIIVEAFYKGIIKVDSWDAELCLDDVNKLRREAGQRCWVTEGILKADIDPIKSPLEIEIRHIYREVNQLADLLCRNGCRNGSTNSDKVDDSIITKLNEDKYLTRAFTRKMRSIQQPSHNNVALHPHISCASRNLSRQC